MKQAESEANAPGRADGKTGLPPPAAHDFGAEEKDAQDDCHIQRQKRCAGVTEDSDGQSNALLPLKLRRWRPLLAIP